MNKFPLATLFSSLIFLAACGGGGGGGGGIVAPSPPTDSGSYSTFSSSISGGVLTLDKASQNSRSVSFTSDGDGDISQVNSESSGTSTAKLTYQGSENSRALSNAELSTAGVETFKVTSPQTLSLGLVFLAAPNAGNIDIIFEDSVSKLSDIEKLALFANPFKFGWSYQTYGVWVTGYRSEIANRGVAAAASFGTPTETIAKTTGDATYRGTANGAFIDKVTVGGNNLGDPYITLASVLAAVNFSDRTVTLSFSDTQGVRVRNPSNAVPLDELNFSGQTLRWSGSTNVISGSISAGTLSGSAAARFYGPNSSSSAPPEIGGTFFLSGSGVERYIGAFGAKR